jgi:putative aminopeptidase FrvX
MEELEPALVIDLDRDPETAKGLRLDLSAAQRPRLRKTPLLQVHSPELNQTFEGLPDGPTELTITIRASEPQVRADKVRNVVGLLRGSEAKDAATYVLLTAHYDHLGIAPQDGSGDRVYNGANDDASGAASMIDIAAALSTLKNRPKRSLVFVAFYGEEHGMIGSQHYAANPAVPLAKTVAVVNLEQLGRTDDSEGPRIAAADVTGFDFSEVGAILHRTGAAVGISVGKRPQNERYFAMSDNVSLARAGVPAHTISVAFQFPDYHAADDEWEKIDYANMAKVDRMVAMGLLLIAEGPAPRWSDNPNAEPYRKAAQTLYAKD